MVPQFRFLLNKILTTGMLLICFGSRLPANAQKIAITFDDLPAHGSLPPGETRMDVAKAILQALQGAGLPPTFGFVNGFQVEQHPGDGAVLDAWRAAGNPLGNHAWSHMNLNEHSLEDFENDILRNEPLLESRMQNQDWRWFRFPYLAEGNSDEKRAGIRKFLAQHGYKSLVSP